MNYPKIGIRPVIDGRWAECVKALKSKQWVWQLLPQSSLKKLFAIWRHTCSVRCFKHNYRRWRRSCCLRGTVFNRKCCCNSFRNSLLVLRYGNIWQQSKTIKAVWGFNGTERPVRFILPLLWLLMHKRVCLHSQSMATMFRIWTTSQFLPMLRKRFCVLQNVPYLLAGWKQVICKPRRYRNGYRRLLIVMLIFPEVSRHPSRVGWYDRNRAQNNSWNLRPRWIRQGYRLGKG